MIKLKDKEYINEDIQLNRLTPDKLEEFIEMHIEEIKYHANYSRKMGIIDKFCENYSREDVMLSIQKHDSFLIEDNKSNILGFIQYNEYNFLNKENGVFISNIFIKEKYRGKGIASAVIDFTSNRFDEIVLEAHYNSPATRLYKHLGFIEVGKILLKAK